MDTMTGLEAAFAIRDHIYQQISNIQDPAERAESKKFFDLLMRPINKRCEKHEKKQQLHQEFEQAMKDGKLQDCVEYERYLKSMKATKFKEYLDSLVWTNQSKEKKRVLWDLLTDKHLFRLRENVHISYNFLYDNTITFKELVDKFESGDKTYYMNYNSPSLLKELFDHGLVTNDDLKYFLLHGGAPYLLDKSCSLRTYILENFLIDSTIYENFPDIFSYIRRNNCGRNIEKLVELNEKVYMLNKFDLTEAQKLELIEVVKTSELAQNKLKNIVDNNLEDNFNFESLRQYLKKSEKKNLINI